jgi:hypothetical protein
MFSVASKYSELHPYVEMVHSGNGSADVKLCFETYAHLRVNPSISGFSGLAVACWPLVPKFASSHAVENRRIFRAKKSSARLPSEGK